MRSVTQETPGTRAMRRDPSFPDVPDSDVVSLLTGHVDSLRATAELILKHAKSNRTRLDLALFTNMTDLGARVLQEVEDVTCSNGCGRLANHISLFAQLCDECDEQERENQR